MGKHEITVVVTRYLTSIYTARKFGANEICEAITAKVSRVVG